MANARGMEFADAFDNLVGAAERAVALRGAAEVHGVAHAESFGGGVECGLVGVVDAGEQQVGGAELFQVAASGGGGDFLQAGFIHFGGDDVGEPAVSEFSGAAEGAIGAAATPDRRAAGLARGWTHRDVGEGAVKAAVVGDRLAAPELSEQGDGFAEAGAAFVAWDAADFVFACEFAAYADAEDQAAFGEA